VRGICQLKLGTREGQHAVGPSQAGSPGPRSWPQAGGQRLAFAWPLDTCVFTPSALTGFVCSLRLGARGEGRMPLGTGREVNPRNHCRAQGDSSAQLAVVGGQCFLFVRSSVGSCSFKAAARGRMSYSFCNDVCLKALDNSLRCCPERFAVVSGSSR
jgi:hypothetical protein